MTPEIEKRIKAVQAGRVPAGYKRTAGGIVPNEWEETPLEKSLVEYKEKTTVANQYPMLTSARAGLMLQSDYYSGHQVTTDDNVGYNVLPRGYVTFRSRSDDGRFKFNENNIIDKGIISYFYPVFSFNNCVDHKYMLFLLNETIYRQMFPYNEGTAQMVLSFNKLKSLQYSIPPKDEQTKIAEILATQDRVIELKENLIAEKQSQKKYLMSVFFDERKEVTKKTQWTTIRIEDIFDENCEKNHPNAEVLTILQGVGTIPREQSGREIIYDKSALSTYKFVKKGDFIIHLRSFEGGLEAANSDGIVSPAYIILRPKIDVSTKYLYALFHTNRFINQTMAPSVEGARDGRSVKYEVLKKQKINLPSLSEQKAVADVLSAADEEISLLQKDLEQEKLKKKSLMQLLLTGLVRVQ